MNWEELAARHERLAKDYEFDELHGFQCDSIYKDGSHSNPNAERARQSKQAHLTVAQWARHIQAFV